MALQPTLNGSRLGTTTFKAGQRSRGGCKLLEVLPQPSLEKDGRCCRVSFSHCGIKKRRLSLKQKKVPCAELVVAPRRQQRRWRFEFGGAKNKLHIPTRIDCWGNFGRLFWIGSSGICYYPFCTYNQRPRSFHLPCDLHYPDSCTRFMNISIWWYMLHLIDRCRLVTNRTLLHTMQSYVDVSAASFFFSPRVAILASWLVDHMQKHLVLKQIVWTRADYSTRAWQLSWWSWLDDGPRALA